MKKYMGCGGQIDERRLAEFEESGLYVAEPKRDGIFSLCVSNGSQKFWSRNGKEKKVEGFPVLPEGTIVAGELAYGQQDALERIQEIGHPFLDVFDIIQVGGANIENLDDEQRRGILESVSKTWDENTREWFRINPRWTHDFQKHYDEESEGLVLKQVKDRPPHPYKPGSRNPYWIKVKKQMTVDLVIMGYKVSEADSYKGKNMAQCVTCGVYKNGKLEELVDVPGLSNALRRDIPAHFEKYEGRVVEVKCYKVFKSGSLRHPSFVQIRDDKDAQDCTWEALVPFMQEKGNENGGAVRQRSKKQRKKQERSKRNCARKPVEGPDSRGSEGVRQANAGTKSGVTDPAQVAKLLDELGNLVALSKADLPEDEQGSIKFKVSAYKKAVYTLSNSGSKFDFANQDPTELEGVGEKLASKIREIVQTGTCCKLEELRREYAEYLPLLEIPGVGPARARTLHDEHGATSVDDVRKLLEDGVNLGKAVKEGVASMNGNGESGRITRAEAKKLSDPMVRKLKKHKETGRVERCGSYRRKKDTVGDIDIVVETENPDAIRVLCESLVDEVILSGEKKVSGYIKGIQVDFRFTSPESFGACILYFTGSKEFNIRQRQIAKKYDYTLNEYGLFNGKRKLAGDDEKEIFDVLGMEYVKPEDRK